MTDPFDGITMTDLRAMSEDERIKHAHAQEERWVLGVWDQDPDAALTLDSLQKTLKHWLTNNAVLHATERLTDRKVLDRSGSFADRSRELERTAARPVQRRRRADCQRRHRT